MMLFLSPRSPTTVLGMFDYRSAVIMTSFWRYFHRRDIAAPTLPKVRKCAIGSTKEWVSNGLDGLDAGRYCTAYMRALQNGHLRKSARHVVLEIKSCKNLSSNYAANRTWCLRATPCLGKEILGIFILHPRTSIQGFQPVFLRAISSCAFY